MGDVSRLNSIGWSTALDPENLTGTGSGYQYLVNTGGALTGMAALGNYLFVFQQTLYTVYSYVVGTTPIQFIRTVPYGCNYHKTIAEVIKDGIQYLIYLSHTGDIRITNGPTYDDILSDNVQSLTKGILNNRIVNDYYVGDGADAAPNAYYDPKNKVYRLFYAGASTYCNKNLNYFVDKEIWTTGSGLNAASVVSLSGYANNLAMVGNSSKSGATLAIVPGSAGTSDIGTFDTGWISTSKAIKKVKIMRVRLWAHAQSGCNTTLTFSYYNDPSKTDSSAVVTETRTLAYNSVANNLQEIFVNKQVMGDYVRVKITDSGSSANYSIDKIAVDYEEVDSTN